MSADQTAAAQHPPAPLSSEALSSDAVLDAALALIGRDGWRSFTLQTLAAHLACPVARVVALFPSREAVVVAALRRVDAAMLAEVEGEDEQEPVRDRLFDLIMRRLDAWDAFKPALAALTREGWFDPLAAGFLLGAWAGSLRRVLEAAGVPVRGLPGLLRVKGLGWVEARVLTVWLDDDTPDMAATMKCLDAALGRAQEADGLLRRVLPGAG